MKIPMRSWRWIILACLAIACVVALIATSINQTVQIWLPIAIALASLVISMFSAFQDVVFPFRLVVVPGGLCTTRHSDVTGGHESGIVNDFDLVLPISFMNMGYGEGVIEALAVKVVGDSGTVMLYRPTMEIDLALFVQGPSVPSKANSLGMFMPFPLHGKQSLRRAWLFSQDTKSNPHPVTGWQPGAYRLEYFVKESQWTRPKQLASMEQVIDGAHINAAQKGVAVVLQVKSIAP